MKVSILPIFPLTDDKLHHDIVKVAVEPQAAGKWFKALQAVSNIQKNYQNPINTQGTIQPVFLFENVRKGKEIQSGFSFSTIQKFNVCLHPHYTSPHQQKKFLPRTRRMNVWHSSTRSEQLEGRQQ